GGFVEAEVESVDAALAERGGGEHAERAGDHGHFIGEDVAEEVFRDEHAEGAGALDELHGGVVDIHVLQLDFGEFLRDFQDGLAPKDGGGEDVRLVYGEEAFFPAHGGGEGDAGDA